MVKQYIHNNRIISVAVYGDIIVTQYIGLIHNLYTDRDDVAEFYYTAENTNSAPHSVGVRIMFDTMLGSNDHAPFKLPNIGDVTTEISLYGDNIPEFWQAFDSLTSPTVIAQGTLKTDAESTPDRVRFTNWGSASSYAWDYTRATGSSNGDSAVCLYWHEKQLKQNDVYSCKTYYGLSSLQQDNRPPLAVALSGATKLEVIEDGNGNKSYSPNPFTVTAYVQNIGTGTAHNAEITLELPNGMEVANGSKTISLGDLPVSNTQKQISWTINVEPSKVEKIEKYGIMLTADNADTKTLSRELLIPELKQNNVDVRLQLDRSSLSNSNNLNLKFKLINNGDNDVDLQNLSTRYYLVDESQNIAKQYNCDYMQLSNPYQYISNNSVIFDYVLLDGFYQNATAYIDIAFNSSEVIKPGQELLITARINNIAWSNFVVSNDYSAIGDDSLPVTDYVNWAYMPVFYGGNLVYGNVPVTVEQGSEPNLLVELNPTAIGNGNNAMNLNIRLTNKDVVELDLANTEIFYYYTNDCGLNQSYAGNYFGGRINNSYKAINDKVTIEIVKMDERLSNADTYVRITFSNDAGVLNYEDYVDLNIQVYNTGWKNGTFILDNDHSYLTASNVQPMTFRALAANNTPGMKTANNIVVRSQYKYTWWEELEGFITGNYPERYNPKYAAFKFGSGTESQYKVNDYNDFITYFEDLFGGVSSKHSTGHNMNGEISFDNENVKAILESDIAYFSSHGYRGGGLKIDGYIAESGQKAGVFPDKKYYDSQMGDTSGWDRYSLKMKDNSSLNINENLQWLILAACNQLNYQKTDDYVYEGKNSADRWLEVLINNKKLKGILGYHNASPDSAASLSDDYIIRNFLKIAYEPNHNDPSMTIPSIYESWITANQYYLTRSSAALLVKAGYEHQPLYKSLCDNSDADYSNIYYYKLLSLTESIGVESFEYYSQINRALQLQGYSLSSENTLVSEISRDTYTCDGEYTQTETVDFLIEITPNQTMATFSAFSNNSPITFLYNVENDTITEM